MPIRLRHLATVLCLLAPLALAPSYAQSYAENPPNWTIPIAPFRIAENLYYVGSKDLASYLIVTPSGDILINSSLTTSPQLIRHSIEQLGFKITDVKILLISHGHFDHDAGSAEILRMSHAKYFVMEGDTANVESGGKTDFAYPDDRYPPAKVDRILHDGEQVRLGNAVLTAHKTPGHTAGCTTWTMQAMSDGKLRDVVIVGSWNVNDGFRLVASHGKSASYPGIAADYEHAFAVFKSLPCDIFLGAHGSYFNMLHKLDETKANPALAESVWIDPDAYHAAVAKAEETFHTTLKRQQDAAAH